jgi:hypothetical protein
MMQQVLRFCLPNKHRVYGKSDEVVETDTNHATYAHNPYIANNVIERARHMVDTGHFGVAMYAMTAFEFVPCKGKHCW